MSWTPSNIIKTHTPKWKKNFWYISFPFFFFSKGIVGFVVYLIFKPWSFNFLIQNCLITLLWLCGSIETVSPVSLGSFKQSVFSSIGLKNVVYHPAAEFTCSEEVLCIFGAVRERDIPGRNSSWLQVPCQKSHYCLILQYSWSGQALSLHLNSKLN